MGRQLAKRIVLVTGASRGIGRRSALELAKEGARLAITARSQPELEKLATEIRGLGAEVSLFPADLTNPEDRERLIAEVVDCFGGLDILVNAAGVASFGEFSTSTPDILRTVMEINFFAPIELIRLAQPHLTRSYELGPSDWRPAVLNVASICGRCGIPSLPEHCGSKHAFVGATEALRAEFVRFGIDVLLVLPGVVRSDDLKRHLLRNEGKIYLNFEGAQKPEEVGLSVVRSLKRNRKESAVGFVSWWVWFGKRAAPRVVRWVMRRKVTKFKNREALETG
jgi:short-subunit dehydrogenase